MVALLQHGGLAVPLALIVLLHLHLQFIGNWLLVYFICPWRHWAVLL